MRMTLFYPIRPAVLQLLVQQCQQMTSMQQKMPAAAPQLSPQQGVANGGQQQGADAVGDVGLLQVLGIAAHLDTVAQRGYRRLIGVGQIGDHVIVGGVKMFDLATSAFDPFAQP